MRKNERVINIRKGFERMWHIWTERGVQFDNRHAEEEEERRRDKEIRKEARVCRAADQAEPRRSSSGAGDDGWLSSSCVLTSSLKPRCESTASKSAFIWKGNQGASDDLQSWMDREEEVLTIGLHRMPAKRVPAASSTAAGCEQTATIGELAEGFTVLLIIRAAFSPSTTAIARSAESGVSNRCHHSLAVLERHH